ncbi:hypothetical protein F7731_08570 [Cytobacillus depressus]|uniref:Uncharacterized protein n=1 Tax=Cytobacillus depressus TaxID=1602942 RepID=A0A6L3V9Q7_9BACI|nr:hypothetical protein [Cytobacillus depressus]KAB2337638.1 hypothetical protein F7731_08570 [Cytobacillus depressus]
MLAFSLVFNETKQKYLKEITEQFFNLQYKRNKNSFDAFQFEKNLSVTIYEENIYFSIVTKEEGEVKNTLSVITNFILEYFINKTIGIHYHQNDFNIKLNGTKGVRLIDF